MIVNNFLTSAEAMQSLDRKIGLRRMWSADSIDFLSRLSPNASQEDLQRYFQHHVEVVADPTDPVIELKVQAFSPADAQLIAKTLVQLAQQKLNEAHLQMQRRARIRSCSEVDQAQQKLKSINDRLIRASTGPRIW